SEPWYRERVVTMRDLFAHLERESRLTSEYSLLGPIRHHLAALIAAGSGASLARDGFRRARKLRGAFPDQPAEVEA
nr:hypothetical protein [Acidobacteriota bacterium]